MRVLGHHVPDFTYAPVFSRSRAPLVTLLNLRPDLRTGVLDLVDRSRIGLQLLDETVGDRHGDVVVGDLGGVVLEGDELHHIGVVHTHDAHVRTAPKGSLLDGVGSLREDLNERQGSLGGPPRRAHEVSGRPQSREAETGTPTGFLDECGRLDRIKNTLDGILHREHEAGREHPHLPTGVHEAGAVGHEASLSHQHVVVLRHGETPGPSAGAEGQLGPRHMRSHAPEELARCFDDLSRLGRLLQVAPTKNRLGVVRQAGVGKICGRLHRFDGCLCTGRIEHLTFVSNDRLGCRGGRSLVLVSCKRCLGAVGRLSGNHAVISYGSWGCSRRGLVTGLHQGGDPCGRTDLWARGDLLLPCPNFQDWGRHNSPTRNIQSDLRLRS